jgi:hypothetical protein
MPYKIYKYPLGLPWKKNLVTQLKIKSFLQHPILDVQLQPDSQNDAPVAWVLVDPDRHGNETVSFYLIWVATGEAVDPAKMHHLKTLQFPNGEVYHLFQIHSAPSGSELQVVE